MLYSPTFIILYYIFNKQSSQNLNYACSKAFIPPLTRLRLNPAIPAEATSVPEVQSRFGPLLRALPVQIFPFSETSVQISQYGSFDVFCLWRLMKKAAFVMWIPETRGTLPPRRCVWIYERYKENLQRESFCLRALLRCINLLVPLRRLPDAPPFHFIKF